MPEDLSRRGFNGAAVHLSSRLTPSVIRLCLNKLPTETSVRACVLIFVVLRGGAPSAPVNLLAIVAKRKKERERGRAKNKKERKKRFNEGRPAAGCCHVSSPPSSRVVLKKAIRGRKCTCGHAFCSQLCVPRKAG